MPSIMPAFANFPHEAEIIGRLLAGYTNLEIGLMNCVQVVRGDFDTVLKAMFRARGETARIDIADAFGRHHYDSAKLGTEFSMAISAVRYCLRIRNQYAHCGWWDDNSGNLALVMRDHYLEFQRAWFCREIALRMCLQVLQVFIPLARDGLNCRTDCQFAHAFLPAHPDLNKRFRTLPDSN
jgi:hypothetical protein